MGQLTKSESRIDRIVDAINDNDRVRRSEKQALKDAATAIVPASTAHALNATFSDVEVETALNALGAKINEILATLESP